MWHIPHRATGEAGGHTWQQSTGAHNHATAPSPVPPSFLRQHFPSEVILNLSDKQVLQKTWHSSTFILHSNLSGFMEQPPPPPTPIWTTS